MKTWQKEFDISLMFPNKHCSMPGITGFGQVTDTHLHKELKKEYWKLESPKMLEKLAKDVTKIPSPTVSQRMSNKYPA